jgi:hypothetical protein
MFADSTTLRLWFTLYLPLARLPTKEKELNSPEEGEEESEAGVGAADRPSQ